LKSSHDANSSAPHDCKSIAAGIVVVKRKNDKNRKKDERSLGRPAQNIDFLTAPSQNCFPPVFFTTVLSDPLSPNAFLIKCTVSTKWE
jgi:hypothetical protein